MVTAVNEKNPQFKTAVDCSTLKNMRKKSFRLLLHHAAYKAIIDRRHRDTLKMSQVAI